MGSYEFGKPEMVQWIKEHFKEGSTCLDVGAGDGKWCRLLGNYLTMDAVEVWPPNAFALEGYWEIFLRDIRKLEYDHYDLIIFGDVLEHMSIKEAQKVLAYADQHSDDYIVSLPFNYKQGVQYGNPYEKHIQDDLNEENIKERYPQLELLLKPTAYYAYYHRRQNG